MNPISEGAASTLCSMLSSTIVYPINAIKVEFQTQKQSTIIKAFRDLYRRNALYSGLRYNINTYPVFWGVFFPIKNHLNLPKTGNSFTDKFLSVSVASTVGSFVANPLFVKQVRSVTGKNTSISNMIAKEGLLSLWKGYPSTVFNNFKLCIQFPMYDYCQNSLDNSILSSAIAKITANTVFYPLDLARTRQRDSIKSLSLQHAFKDLYQQYGYRGFYRGIMIYNAMSVPNFCLMMFFIENIKPFLK